MDIITKRTFLILTACTVYFYASAQSDGTLDPSFGTGGLVTVDNSNNSTDDGNDLLLMADKSIIVGGTSYINGTDLSFCSFVSSGALNNAFGTGGKFLWDISNGSTDYLNALAVDSSQRIIGVGYSYIGTDEFLIVVRLSADGTPDASFGTDGVVKLNPAVTSIAYDVAIQPDDKIVIAGSVDDGLTPIKSLVIRLNDDGSYDGAFGDAGVWEGSPDPSYDGEAYSIALQTDGKILIAGYHNVSGDDQFAAGRILPGGSQDVSFDGDGWVVKNLTIGTNDIAHGVALQGDGKILLAGESNGEVAICRLNSDGSDDTGFADNGTFIDPLLANDDVLYSVILQPDDMILAAGGGSIDDNVDFLLLRLTSEGILDPTFDSDGIVYTNFNGSNDYAHSILLQPDLRIVAAGSAFSGYFTDFAVARYAAGFTGTDEKANHFNVTVYPNPSDGSCTLKITGAGEVMTYDVMDLAGRKITNGEISINTNSVSLEMKQLPAGIYFVECKGKSKQTTIAREKIVIR